MRPHQGQWMLKQKMSLLTWSDAFNTTEASLMVRRGVGHCGSFQGMLLCQQVSVKVWSVPVMYTMFVRSSKPHQSCWLKPPLSRCLVSS